MKGLKGTFFYLLFVAITGLSAQYSVAADGLAPPKIVANPSVAIGALTPSQLRQIFSLRQSSWPDGQVITIYVLANQDPLHQRFCKEMLGMFPYQVERIWNNFVYSGIAELPFVVKDETEMMERIKNNPGSIGYVTQTPADEGVSVIELEKE